MKNFSSYPSLFTFPFFYKKINPTSLFVFLFSLLLCWGNETYAQPNLAWQTVVGGSEGEFFYDLKQTVDGDILVLGRSSSSDGDVSSNNGESDFWIIKFDSDGALLWEKNLGGTGREQPGQLILRPNGGAIITGNTESSATGDLSGSSNGGKDAWVVAINDSGEIDWETNFGGSNDEYIADIKTTSDGGYILVGRSNSDDGIFGNGLGDYDLFVVKLSATGAIEWSRRYGGSGEDAGISVDEIDGGNFLVGATTFSSDGDISLNYGSQDIWILNLDPLGNIFLQKTLGGTSADRFYDISPTSDGGFVGVGKVASSNLTGGGSSNNLVSLVVKLDANLAIEWTEVIESGGGFGVKFITQTLGGKYIALDYENNIHQLDEQGKEEWEFQINDPAYELMGTFNFQEVGDKILAVGTARAVGADQTNFDGLIYQLGLSTVATPCPGDLVDFTALGEFDGSKYYISNDISRPVDAQLVAEMNGGNLAIIDSQEENDFIQQNISEMAYIGLGDSDVEGELIWANGDALNYNNINPCNFCESNSDDQDFVIMQPWDGGWSFSNFYNQRKYVIEVVCNGGGGGGTPPTTDTTGCYFLSNFSAPSAFSINQCVEETPSGFTWYAGETLDYIDPFFNFPLTQTQVNISDIGNVTNNYQETFEPLPQNFTVLGISKNKDLAFAINNSLNEFVLCHFNWQELWGVPIVGINFDYLEEFSISETEDEIILLGIRDSGNGSFPFIMVMDLNTGAVKIDRNIFINTHRKSQVVKGQDGNYYIFGRDEIAKMDPLGNFIWFTSINALGGEYASFLGETPDGSAIFATMWESQTPVVAMLDVLTGTPIWEKDLNSILPPNTSSDSQISLSGVPTLDGGITVGFNTQSNSIDGYFLANLNQNCEVEWQQEYDGSYQFYSLQLATSDGGYILTQPSSGQNVNFLKLNSYGLEEPNCGTGLPDLYVQDFFILDNGNTQSYLPQDLIQYFFNYGNQGTFGPGSYKMGIYLGDKSFYETDDILLDEFTVNSLDFFLSTFNYESLIPTNIPTGAYALHVVIDNLEQVVESDENNNVVSSGFFEIINSTSGCPDNLNGFTFLGTYGGSNYFLSEETAKPLDAIASALQNGGHLAAIGSQAENDFLASQLTEMTYIGLNDFDVEGEIVWEDGNPITFTNFDICDFCNENTPDMDFVVMHNWNGGWSWSNFYNSRKYVVEIACPMILLDPINNTLISILPNALEENVAEERAIYLEKVFPNPAEDFIFTQIKSTVEETVEAHIFDVRGVLLKSQKVDLTLGVNQIQMNIQDLTKGIYSIFIPNANEGFTTIRFVK